MEACSELHGIDSGLSMGIVSQNSQCAYTIMPFQLSATSPIQSGPSQVGGGSCDAGQRQDGIILLPACSMQTTQLIMAFFTTVAMRCVVAAGTAPNFWGRSALATSVSVNLLTDRMAWRRWSADFSGYGSGLRRALIVLRGRHGMPADGQNRYDINTDACIASPELRFSFGKQQI